MPRSPSATGRRILSACGGFGWADTCQPPLSYVSAVGLSEFIPLELFVCNPCLQGIWQGSLLKGAPYPLVWLRSGNVHPEGPGRRNAAWLDFSISRQILGCAAVWPLLCTKEVAALNQRDKEFLIPWWDLRLPPMGWDGNITKQNWHFKCQKTVVKFSEDPTCSSDDCHISMGWSKATIFNLWGSV